MTEIIGLVIACIIIVFGFLVFSLANSYQKQIEWLQEEVETYQDFVLKLLKEGAKMRGDEE